MDALFLLTVALPGDQQNYHWCHVVCKIQKIVEVDLRNKFLNAKLLTNGQNFTRIECCTFLLMLHVTFIVSLLVATSASHYSLNSFHCFSSHPPLILRKKHSEMADSLNQVHEIIRVAIRIFYNLLHVDLRC
ncbi:hypothetical protein T4D_15359 [Trichinella pseudospiralis]|uniref:Uncharacterized protein n=1 Tax=Trichinella pseudospiralis TaxID=6337 RepID=A0A0V1FBA2_TRIPS|nr:hypothetical protein T4D_15359 [Trichinella pseudospiralis]